MFQEEPLFLFFALTGSALFLFQFLFNLFLGEDSDADVGKFKWLSKQAVTGFMLMFGWGGLTCRKEFGCSYFSATFVALFLGGFTVLVTALLLHWVKKLRSTGTIFLIDDAVGKEALVYQQIPKSGIGKISISLDHFTHEIDATAEEDIPAFVSVRIIKKVNETTLFVQR